MEKVLVVDDEQDVRTLICEFLEISGYECVGAEDGLDGWDKYLTSKPALALIDLEMPRMNGLQLSRKILEHNPGFPILIITAHQHKYTDQIEKLGIKGVEDKPLKLWDLVKRIENILS